MGISLMDVNSGKSIPLSNYTGKVVLISLFSTSCADCLQQQKTLESLNMQNQNGLVVVTLDVDPKDNAGVLANFARQNNYHWVFGNSTDTINQGLNKLYNSQSINPTALQTLVIDRMGDVHALPNGMKSSSELSQDLASYLAAQ
jgi:cytochrome oxidase Cu insertion factor (SCO1/SenC/PrrC family)